MKKKNLRVFTWYYFISQLTFAIASVQRIPYLKSIGYTALERSYMLSALALITIIGQLFFGYISDKHEKIKRYVLFVTLCFSIFSFFTFSVDANILIYHFIFVVLSGSTQNIIIDLNDSWIMQSGDEVRNNLGFIKSFQSFGYATGALVGSSIISLLGYKSFSVILLLLGVIMAISANRLDDIKKVETKTMIKFSDIAILLKSKLYVLALILFTGYFTIAQVHAISVAEKILFLNGNETHIAFRVIVAVGLEGFGYMICNKLYNKVGPYKLLTVSSVAYIIMYTLFIFATSPIQMIVIAGLQLLTVPFYIVPTKNLIFKISPDNLKTSGQLVVAALSMGVSGTLTPLVVGMLSTNYGCDAPLILVICIGVFTILITYILKAAMKHQGMD